MNSILVYVRKKGWQNIPIDNIIFIQNLKFVLGIIYICLILMTNMFDYIFLKGIIITMYAFLESIIYENLKKEVFKLNNDLPKFFTLPIDASLQLITILVCFLPTILIIIGLFIREVL